MIKTLEQINREFMEEHSLIKTEMLPDESFAPPAFAPPENIAAAPAGPIRRESIPGRLRQAEAAKGKKKRKAAGRAKDIALYTAVILVLAAMLFFNVATDRGFQVFGYSGFTAPSGSMHGEVPEGALVLVKKTDPDEIGVGDDITFVDKEDHIVTHRVISIVENHEQRGDRGFVTQGIENSDPDRDIIFSENVIGVVEHIIPRLGRALSYITEYIGIFLLIAVIALVVIKLSSKYREKKGKKQLKVALGHEGGH